jgi:periplasmic protein TonB
MNTSVADKRPLGALGRMGMVAGLHAGALYLIAMSLGVVPPLIKEEPVTATLRAPEVVPIDEPEPTPRPEFEPPTLTVPKPEVPQNAFDAPDEPMFAEVNDAPPVIPDIIPAAAGPVLVAVRMDSRHPLTQPAYPAIDQRLGNEGFVDLEIYVMPTGRVGDARVLKSTGSATLDQSAIDEAKRKWRLLPATRDGEPVAQWHRLRVVFKLQNR